jgi:hypothetical protein
LKKNELSKKKEKEGLEGVGCLIEDGGEGKGTLVLVGKKKDRVADGRRGWKPKLKKVEEKEVVQSYSRGCFGVYFNIEGSFVGEWSVGREGSIGRFIVVYSTKIGGCRY